MPALRCCIETGCHALTPSGRCAAHSRLQTRGESRWHLIDQHRGSAHSRGYDHKWQTAAAAYLAAHPLCVHCERKGRLDAAAIVDHIKPHRGDKALFWNSCNWQGLCYTCDCAKKPRENQLVQCAHEGAPVDIGAERVCVWCGGEV